MYAIIYWEKDSTVKPLLNEDGITLTLFEKLSEADKRANEIETISRKMSEPVKEARVISIEGVEE